MSAQIIMLDDKSNDGRGITWLISDKHETNEQVVEEWFMRKYEFWEWTVAK